ncbi:MAG: tRNA pseudouridine(13) synthase TruD [Polyangiaceae bacterium]|nr:tRNA pseudouridine(13) synthase TruD [Polyangiaceae bacterium]
MTNPTAPPEGASQSDQQGQANSPSAGQLPLEPPLTYPQLRAPGGRIGEEPADFLVEEIPAYEPSGAGEHLYLWIEKTGVNSQEVVRRLSRVAQVTPRDIGMAGMKDRNATTKQWFSLLSKADPSGWDLGDEIKILQHTRHGNKLRTGHLIGNRFRIRLCDTASTNPDDYAELIEALTTKGIANYYGPQRFGRQGRNLEEALRWLRKNQESAEDSTQDSTQPLAAASKENRGKAKGRRRQGRRKSGQRGLDPKMLVSVIQSELFNRYISLRLQNESPALIGEVMRLNGTGSHFVVEDAQEAAQRVLEGDIHSTGAMWGRKTVQNEGEARQLELEAARWMGLDQEDLDLLNQLAPGTRRDLMLLPEGLVVTQTDGRLCLEFSLPSGAFATQIAREFTQQPYFTPRGAPTEERERRNNPSSSEDTRSP